ncbi:MAG TPA: glycosyltransferase family 39 protein [Planctomycetota bacterium]|nr:glycosyltransferase family 39 protein [Planctomycetota bacterium]
MAPANASTRGALALILGAGLLIFVPSLVTRDPWNPDEPRATEVAREMAASGNYLVPHLNGAPYSDKPPVFYWLASGFWHLGFGLNSGRMVSLLASLGTAVLVYALGRRTHSPETGLVAALVTLTVQLFPFIGKQGVLDPLLACFTTASIYCAVAAFEGGERRGRWWLAAYALAALAFLTKGPVGIAVPLLVAAAYGVLRRGAVRKGGWWHLAGAALLVGMVAAWLAPACIHGGKEYTNDILFQQTAQRMGEEASHRQPWYHYVAFSPGYLLPWTPLLVLALVWVFRTRRGEGDRAAILGAAWFIAVLVFFSLFSGKRERYLLPLVPAVGLLCGRYIVAVIKGERSPLRGHQGLWKASFVLLGLIAIALGAVALEPGAVARRFAKDPEVMAEVRAALTPGVLVGAGVSGLVMLGLCFWGIRLPRGGAGEMRRVLTLAGATLVLGLAVDLLATPIINRFKTGRDLVEAAGPYLSDADEVILYQSDYSGVYNLFARRTRMPVLYKEEELRHALRSPRRVAVIAKEGREVSARDLEKASGARVVAQERVGHRRIVVLANWKAPQAE